MISPLMEADKLSVLHDHYRDSCAALQRTRASRDRYLYLALAVLAIALFDFALPQGFEVLVADTLKSQIPFATALDVGYLSSLLLFLLLGFAIRYCQCALAIQRQDAYLRRLETLLSSHLGGAFSPEGDAQIDSPFFLEWAHYLYSFLFPLLLAGFTVVWTYRQTPASWRWSTWFDDVATAAIVISIVIYLVAFQRQDRRTRGTGAARALS